MLVKLVIIGIVCLGIVWFFKTMVCRKSHAGDKKEGGNQVYVGNLSFRVRERQLREAFSEYGDIRSLRLIKDRDTGRSKGYAFITFKSAADAKRSYAMHGKDFHGRALVVRSAMRKAKRK